MSPHNIPLPYKWHISYITPRSTADAFPCARRSPGIMTIPPTWINRWAAHILVTTHHNICPHSMSYVPNTEIHDCAPRRSLLAHLLVPAGPEESSYLPDTDLRLQYMTWTRRCQVSHIARIPMYGAFTLPTVPSCPCLATYCCYCLRLPVHCPEWPAMEFLC